jgi:TrmH family RNA methyltransferase
MIIFDSLKSIFLSIFNPMSEYISSTKNPKIRNLIHLKKSGVRKKQSLIIIEGEKEVKMALEAGVKIPTLFICREFLKIEFDQLFSLGIKTSDILNISSEVFNHVAYRQNSGGIIGIGIPNNLPISSLNPGKNSIYIILEAVEKPGNLGGILRTADAAGVSGLIVCDPKTDIYNPNVIRSSLGCIFSVNTVTASSEAALAWLRQNQVISFATHLATEELYFEQDFSGRIAFVMGTESEGLTDFWKTGADKLIKIPMLGQADSMNVSVATAIVLFEALRQRDFVV